MELLWNGQKGEDVMLAGRSTYVHDNKSCSRQCRMLRLMRVAAICVMLLALLIPAVRPAEAGAAANYKVKTLKPAKTYKLNLNGGRKEKVRYKLVSKSNYRQQFRLYVNGKCVYKKMFSPAKRYSLVGSVKYLDIQRSDKYRELLLDLWGDESNQGAMVLRYYNANKIKAFYSYKTGLMDRIDSKEIKNAGNNKFYLTADTPFSNESFGCYYARMPFKLSDSTIKNKTAGKYKLMRVSEYAPSLLGSQYYELARYMEMYTTDSMETISRDCYAGTKFTPTYVKVLDQQTVYYGGYPAVRYNLLVKVKLSTGESGWLYFPAVLDSNESQYLKYKPAWG